MERLFYTFAIMDYIAMLNHGYTFSVISLAIVCVFESEAGKFVAPYLHRQCYRVFYFLADGLCRCTVAPGG